MEEEHTSTRFPWDYCSSGSGGELLSSMPFQGASEGFCSSWAAKLIGEDWGMAGRERL